MSNKWVILADKIIAQTKAGKLNWQETSAEYSFQVTIGRNVVELDEDGFSSDYEFRIRDGSGKVIDKFTDEDLSAMTQRPYLDELGSLVRLIRRQISGTEQVLDDLLRELNERDSKI